MPFIPSDPLGCLIPFRSIRKHFFSSNLHLNRLQSASLEGPVATPVLQLFEVRCKGNCNNAVQREPYFAGQVWTWGMSCTQKSRTDSDLRLLLVSWFCTVRFRSISILSLGGLSLTMKVLPLQIRLQSFLHFHYFCFFSVFFRCFCFLQFLPLLHPNA